MYNVRALVSQELHLVNKCLKDILVKDNEVFTDLSDFVNGKSRKIRSLICLLYLKAHNITINNNLVIMLCVTELIHNASLLHDDVVDNSPIRRGIPNLYGKYGSKISVLLGDYALSVAVKILFSLNNNEILDIFLNATEKMSKAEIVQFSNRGRNITVDEYLRVAEGKTASLFCACLISAAELSGLDKNKAENFAIKFGTLFQINNDLKEESVINDKENSLNTLADIIGIEKTFDLKDNYKEELSMILENIPENEYKKGIKDLIRLL